jgi:hypothetical protein
MNITKKQSDLYASSQLQDVLNPKEFLFVHEKGGHIREFISVPTISLHSFFGKLLSQKELEPFFDISPLAGPETDGPKYLRGRGVSTYEFDFGSVFSRVPLHFLLTKPLGNGLYMARVTISDVTPNIQMKYGQGFFFTDFYKEIIEGYDQTFIPRLLGAEGPPTSMLGQSLSNYISPTPQEFQDAHIDRFEPGEAVRFNTLYDADLRQGIRPEGFSVPGAATETLKGLLVEAPAQQSVFLRFFPLVDTDNYDVILDISVEQIQRGDPYFTIGHVTADDEEPDNWGYMMGQDLVKPNCVRSEEHTSELQSR